jgi:hypothetical protein
VERIVLALWLVELAVGVLVIGLLRLRKALQKKVVYGLEEVGIAQ